MEKFLPYIPGIIIFLVGSSQVREWLKKRNDGFNTDEMLFHPLTMMIVGALLILLALFESQKKEVEAMICLTLIFIGSGISLLYKYFSLKKKNLKPVEAEIIDIHKRQLAKETRILVAAKFTYYPIVKYEINGRECKRMCNINSSSEKTFKIGDKMSLYYEPATGAVLEKHAHPAMIISGTILFAIGALAGLSILSVVL